MVQQENTKSDLDVSNWRCYQNGMNRLRKLREAKGLTQAQLAELAGTSQPQIKRLENGERKLTKEWAERLAPHLGTDAQDVLFGDNDNDHAEAGSSAYEQIGHRLAKVRLALGLDPYEIALRLGISPTEWQSYEAGLSLISLDAMAKVLDLMPGLASDWILFGNRSKLTIEADMALKAVDKTTTPDLPPVARR